MSLYGVWGGTPATNATFCNFKIILELINTSKCIMMMNVSSVSNTRVKIRRRIGFSDVLAGCCEGI
jgi:hypothetical protein